MAMGRCFLVQDASRHLQLEVVIENLLYSLTDAQWIKHLHVRHAIEKDNTRDKFVGMLHLFDRFFMPLLGKRLVAPIVKEPVMKPVLVHCRQLTAKAFVKILDDFRVASHIDHSYRYGEHWAGNLRVYSATAESIHQTPKMQEDNRSDTWARAMAQCPLLAQSGHFTVEFQYLLSGVKRTLALVRRWEAAGRRQRLNVAEGGRCTL